MHALYEVGKYSKNKLKTILFVEDTREMIEMHSLTMKM